MQELIQLPTGATLPLSEEQIATMNGKATNMQTFSQNIFKFEVAEQFHAATIKPKLPATVSDIPDAEKALEMLKYEYKACEERTKALTGPLNGVVDRLNGYKKLILDERTEKGRKIRTGHIADLENALLPLKQKEAYDKDIARERQRTLDTFRLECINALSDAKTKALMLIQQWKTAAYTNALTNVAVENIGAYKVACAQKATATLFQDGKPFHCNDLDKESIANEIYKAWEPQYYADLYASELTPLFADFANAKNNESVAAQAQRDQEFAATMKVAEEGGQQKAAAAIQAAAAPTPIYSGGGATIATKELKKSWKVDMPDDWNTVLELMKAYSVAQAQVQGKLRVDSIWSLTMQQLANALAAIKNDDPNFAPQGINFTQIDKL